MGPSDYVLHINKTTQVPKVRLQNSSVVIKIIVAIDIIQQIDDALRKFYKRLSGQVSSSYVAPG